jgi:hypothetical protein
MSTRPQLPARANPFFRTFVLSQLMHTLLGDVWAPSYGGRHVGRLHAE